MSKTKNPFFSMGSQGSIGNAITTQRAGSETIIRKKPFPTDPYSLPQAYQRWEYQDYVYQWHQLTADQKRAYSSPGCRYHLTGFAYFMKTKLATLPDLAARWRLDETAGVVASDSSRNSNDLVITGATPVAGQIAGAYYFDGLNDHLTCPDHPSLRLQELSIEFFVVGPTTATAPFVAKYHSVDRWSWRFHLAAGNVYAMVLQADGRTFTNTIKALVTGAGITTHLCFTYDQQWQRLYFNGVEVAQDNVGAIAIPYNAGTLDIGRYQYVGWKYGGSTLDNIIIHNRCLDQPIIAIHSDRRYPIS